MGLDHASWRVFVLGGLLIGLSVPLIASAVPYTPADDAVILERLPLKPTDRFAAELRSLRRALMQDPNNLALARKLAQSYIKQARLDSDPRYLGYAQAALAPWWEQSQPPAEVRVLRAIVLQANHQFMSALADLDAVLRYEPTHAQALLTRASIQQARGEYDAARKNCAALVRSTSQLIGVTCLAAVASLNGEAQRSYALMQRVIQQSPDMSPDMRQWIESLLADAAARLGDAATANRHYQLALAAAPADSYLLASYADFLLDQGRAADVVELLRERTRADPLFLRLAIAEQMLNLPEATDHAASLDSRFEASRLRGDVTHRREEARFALFLRNDASRALRLAEENWAVQREPADARILLEAALAANAPRRAQPLLKWLVNARMEDVYLTKIAGHIEAFSP